MKIKYSPVSSIMKETQSLQDPKTTHVKSGEISILMVKEVVKKYNKKANQEQPLPKLLLKYQNINNKMMTIIDLI